MREASSSLDDVRRAVSATLDPVRRSKLGQFMTPSVIADYMSSLFGTWPKNIKLLEPGAGIGSLVDAFAREFTKRSKKGSTLEVTAYEIEAIFLDILRSHLTGLAKMADESGRSISFEIVEEDFIASGTFEQSFEARKFTHALLNPPYKKIGASAKHRALLRSVGVETVNLYTAFLAIALGLLKDKGEMVAIVPRSFCNGLYYRPFREWMLSRAAIKEIHVFESRKKAFKEDDVLQENIIIHLVRGGSQGDVIVSSSHDATFADLRKRVVPFREIIRSEDKQSFIHIPIGKLRSASKLFAASLEELELKVSTGPVVDFRLKDYWLADPEPGTVPLLYAHHFVGGELCWPKKHKKPNALRGDGEVPKWLLPRGWYVVTKRFTSKEERRRVVAYVVDPNLLPATGIGFENHLNVFHSSRRGLDPNIARGLAIFLNSTVVDEYFRNFSGHTQVNATDLRSMRFPNRDLLIEWGRWASNKNELTQLKIDELLERQYD